MTGVARKESLEAGAMAQLLRALAAARFSSQHSYEGSQLNTILVLGDLMPTSGFLRHCTHMVHVHTCRHALIHLSKSKENFKK